MLFVWFIMLAFSNIGHSFAASSDINNEALKVSIERLSDLNQSNSKNLSDPCTTNKNQNRYATMKSFALEKCLVLGAKIPGCQKVVEDTFEIASPYCPTGSLAKQATNCTMLSKYIIEQFSKSSEKYNRILSDVVSGMRTNKKNPLNIYEVVLSASNQNKSDAIFVMSLVTFGQILIPEIRVGGNAALADSLSDFYQTAAKTRNSSQKVVAYPPGFENSAQQFHHKGYHFWTRAFLANQLVLKGHSKALARAVATSTSAFYEFKIDWKEHQAQGISFNQRLKAATSDVLFSDKGSQFGSE